MSASSHFQKRRLKGAETENPYNYKYSLSLSEYQNWKKETDKRKNRMTDI